MRECPRIYKIKLAPHFVEWMRLDLGELVLHVIRVHGLDLLSRWRTKHLDDLHQLVDPTLSREERLAEHELRHDTSG